MILKCTLIVILYINRCFAAAVFATLNVCVLQMQVERGKQPQRNRLCNLVLFQRDQVKLKLLLTWKTSGTVQNVQ